LRCTTPALGVCLAAELFGGFGAGSAPAAVKAVVTPEITIITVTAGKPSELSYKLSKFSMLPVGPITFKVTNRGLGIHNFKICTTPVKSSAKNTCTGVGTKKLMRGQSTTIKVTFKKSGKYEFLCAIPGHAAAGMKGLLGVGVAVAASQSSASVASNTSSGSFTTTNPGTTAGGGGGGGGGVNADAGCPAGQTIAQNIAAGNAGGDVDEDDWGGATDGDGCL
jgi:plastocyanin